MLYHCQFCGKPFEASPAARRKFCSRECWRKSLVKKVERTCETCGKTFLAPRYKVEQGQGRFCSRECVDTGWDEPCATCGKPVHRTPNHAERFDHVFCSRECYAEFCRDRITKTCPVCGEKFTDKRSKMTNGRGVYCSQECFDIARAAEVVEFTCQYCGKVFTRQRGHVGPHMYTGQYCSRECASLARRLPDSTRSVYNHEFTEELKEQIRERDGRVCQICRIETDITKRRLPVHHIDYDKTNNDPSNLISLCDSCHSQTNYNRDHWQSILQDKVPA